MGFKLGQAPSGPRFAERELGASLTREGRKNGTAQIGGQSNNLTFT